MLRREDNDLISHVGPGTPMGNVFRQYWLPALLTSELPRPDSDPVRFRTERVLANDFLIDRALQRFGDGPFAYTGIDGVATEDMAVTTSMGPIVDRSRERLGSSDAAIIRMRRRLLDAARALADRGLAPPGVDDPEAYRQRSGSVVLPETADWIEASAPLRQAFVSHANLDRRPGGVIP